MILTIMLLSAPDTWPGSADCIKMKIITAAVRAK
jgi:hypothetical protein